MSISRENKRIYDKLRREGLGRKEILAKKRAYSMLLKKSSFDAYGRAVCVLCGNECFDVLTIDHIYGGGTQHTNKFGGRIYAWLKKNNYPLGFRVLCRNCNDADGYLKHYESESSNYFTLYSRDYKKRVFKLLGENCVLCGEHKKECLHLDHINGGGNQHRLERGHEGIYRDVVNEEFPGEKYRILCSNCNWLEYLKFKRSKKMTKAFMVIDGCWGSTGKGLIAGYLALKKNPDTAVCNFSANAGHTVVLDDGRVVMTQVLPTAIISLNTKTILIGPGAAVDPNILAKELESFSDLLQGKQVYIHDMAAVICKEHKDREAAELNRISSTCKGVGAAQCDKVMRIPGAVVKNSKEFEKLNVKIISGNEFTKLITRSRLLQIESAQGLELGFSSGGWYPYCTSRDINVYQVLSDCGIPYSIKPEVIVSMRTFPIRVGDAFDAEGKQIGTSGPVYDDMKEISWGMLGVKEERTTVTKKIRRVFTFSIRNLEKVIEVLHPDGIFLNFTNYLDKTPEFGSGNTGGLIDIIDSKWRHITQTTNPIVKWIGVGPKVQDVHERPTVDFIDEGN